MIRSSLLGDLVNLSNTLDQMTTQRLGGSLVDGQPNRSRTTGVTWSVPMPIDVYATHDRAVIIAAVPGMQPDDLDLTIHQNTVTLSGTVRNSADAEETRDATWYVSELGSGSFQRSITLPFPVDADHAMASFEHGLVRVSLPKADSAKPKKIAISTSSDQAIAANNQEA